LRVAYVTALFPYEQGEGFLIEEVRALGSLLELFVVPVRLQTREPYHPVEGAKVLPRPLIALDIIAGSLIEFLTRPLRSLRSIATVLRADRRPAIRLKNMAVVPKALWLSRRVRLLRIRHIHAHWAGTSATMAWLAADVAGVPWSLTAHRWDIDEGNALAEKLHSATFTRAISQRGLDQLKRVDNSATLMVIPMGVAIPGVTANVRETRKLRLFVPANLFRVKGHRYLLRALALLSEKAVVESCDLAGSGPELEDLAKLTRKLDLLGIVHFLGAIAQGEVIRRYQESLVDAVILPSIVTTAGEQEGVPVALMEAMAYAVPVIATRTGAISELVEGAGLLVPPEDAVALSEAILSLLSTNSRRELGAKGRDRVCSRFSVSLTSARLAQAIQEATDRADLSTTA